MNWNIHFLNWNTNNYSKEKLALRKKLAVLTLYFLHFYQDNCQTQKFQGWQFNCTDLIFAGWQTVGKSSTCHIVFGSIYIKRLAHILIHVEGLGVYSKRIMGKLVKREQWTGNEYNWIQRVSILHQFWYSSLTTQNYCLPRKRSANTLCVVTYIDWLVCGITLSHYTISF